MKKPLAFALANVLAATAFAQSDEQMLKDHFRSMRSEPRVKQDAFMSGVANDFSKGLPMRIDKITVMTSLQYLAAQRVLTYVYDIDPGGRALNSPEVFREKARPQTIANTCTNPMAGNFIEQLGGEVDHLYRLPTAQVRVTVTAEACSLLRQGTKR